MLEHIQKHPDRSLGIIAFSEKQQAAIENAIIDFREKCRNMNSFLTNQKTNLSLLRILKMFGEMNVTL